MGTIDFSQPLLGAGASAQSDFASAQARTGLDFTGNARFKRGFKVELGLDAFADASAGLSKFIGASVAGTAFARAKAGVQLQLPLNLFDEFGLAIRAEAIAEAAVGATADVHLNIGDFVALAQRDPQLIGMPLELFLLLLEETKIGGRFDVNVSASAKAHASISISGTVIETSATSPGFFYTVDAGVGLAAGVGFGFQAGVEFEDFRRFYGRAVDLLVDSVVGQVNEVLPEDLRAATGPAIRALAPLAKIALRSVYEIGSTIKKRNPQFTPQSTQELCNDAIRVFLEEFQRLAFSSVVDFAIDQFRKAIEARIAAAGASSWNALQAERTAVANRLLAMPRDPFQPTAENAQYWSGLVGELVGLVSGLAAGGAADPDLVEALTAAYCGEELLVEMFRSNVNRSSAYALAVGAGGVQSDNQPFKGPLAQQPPVLIAAEIRRGIGAATNATVRYADLLGYLVRPALLNDLVAAVPGLRDCLAPFTGQFSIAEPQLLELFLSNVGAFHQDGSTGPADAKDVLSKIVHSIDDFLTHTLSDQVLPQILANIGDPTLRTYFEEVIFAAILRAKELGLNTLLSWDGQAFDKADYTEALAGVMMLLLGRSVITLGDAFLTTTEVAVESACQELADNIERDDPSVQAITQMFSDPAARQLVVDSVRIGGEVLGPIPQTTRERIRRVLYQVLEPLPLGSTDDFLAQLADDFFVPNDQDLQDLGDLLVALAAERFGRFATGVVDRIGDVVLDALSELLDAAAALVMEWAQELGDQLRRLAMQLRNAEATIRRLNTAAAALLVEAEDALRAFFGQVSGATLRRSIRDQIEAEVIDRALDALESESVYGDLPFEWRMEARRLVRRSVGGLIDDPMIDPVFDAVDGISDELASIIPDCRELDPNENLPEQLLERTLDRIEDRIRSHFGSTSPSIIVSIDFTYSIPVVGTQAVHIPVGRVKLPLGALVQIIRGAVTTLDFYHDSLDAAAIALADLLANELDAAAALLSYDRSAAQNKRLEDLLGEHHRHPQELLALAPTALSDYRSDVPVRVHVGGVGVSVLGRRADEAQRLLVFVNGELLPSDRFTLTEDPPSPASGSRPPAPTLPFPGGRGRVSHSVLDRAGEVRVSSQQLLGTSLTARKLGPREITSVTEGLLPGFMAATEIDLSTLVEGVNVLTAVLIEADGSRQQQNITFTVARPDAAVRPPRGGRGQRLPPARITVAGLVPHLALPSSRPRPPHSAPVARPVPALPTGRRDGGGGRSTNPIEIEEAALRLPSSVSAQSLTRNVSDAGSALLARFEIMRESGSDTREGPRHAL